MNDWVGGQRVICITKKCYIETILIAPNFEPLKTSTYYRAHFGVRDTAYFNSGLSLVSFFTHLPAPPFKNLRRGERKSVTDR